MVMTVLCLGRPTVGRRWVCGYGWNLGGCWREAGQRLGGGWEESGGWEQVGGWRVARRRLEGGSVEAGSRLDGC